MHPLRSCLLLVLALLLPVGASAFSVPNHEALTRAALDAVHQEGGTPVLERYRATLLEATQAEDLNLPVKWTGWNHFYHPGVTLDSAFRKDSSARVRALWEEAEEAASQGQLERAFDRVGHLVHHIQDMASPPHVVPVMHGLNDRFEQQPLSALVLARAPERQLAPMSGPEAQDALARETLEVVRTGSLSVEGGAIPWSAFWAEPVPPTPGVFGSYGAAGNSFGQTRVRWRGREWTVDPARYAEFLDARTDAAVAYSRAFLLWAAQRLTVLAEAHTPRFVSGPWRPSAQLALEVMGGAVTTPRGTTPVAGARAFIPLPWSFALSAGYARTLLAPVLPGEEQPLGGGAWSLALLSPPLLAQRLGYSAGVSLRATVGGGLSHQEDQRIHPELPVGLRLQAQLGNRFLLSAEAQYRLFSPTSGPWANGVTFTVGTGFTWGDS